MPVIAHGRSEQVEGSAGLTRAEMVSELANRTEKIECLTVPGDGHAKYNTGAGRDLTPYLSHGTFVALFS